MERNRAKRGPQMSERKVGWVIDGQPGQYTVTLKDGTPVGTFQWLGQVEKAADKAFAWLEFKDIKKMLKKGQLP